MLKFIREMFQSPEGEVSQKRVSAFILIINGIIMSYMGNPLGIGVIGTGTAILVAQAITKT